MYRDYLEIWRGKVEVLIHGAIILCETALVIVAVGKRLHAEMETEAKRQGFQQIVWYEEIFY